MLELARYEARRRVRGTLYLTVGLVVFAGMYIATFPSIQTDIDLDQFIESLPEIFTELFNLATMNTIEGFLAAELYSLGWTLLLGMYLAYSGGTLIAADVDRKRMDLLLSLPLSRRRVVAEKFLSLLVPILGVNVVVPVAVLVGTTAVAYPIDPVNLAVVHLLSVPYLLACAALGLVLSVVFSRVSVAQRGALVAIFALYLFESVVVVADVGWLGVVAPMRYYAPTAVLVEGSYDWLGAAILLAATGLLVAASAAYFTRRDVQ
jgi:ABC-2 type transport system permease protein